MTRGPLADRLQGSFRARPDLFAIGLLLTVSLAIRVRSLTRPFHGDEMITFSNMVLGRGFGEIIFGPFDGNSHLLNSLIMKAVYLGFGEVPALMRLPNLIFTLLAIVILYLSCSRELGRTPAFAAALLFSLHPAIVLFSVSGRGYAGMVLFTLISSTLFLGLLTSFSWSRWLFCAIAGVLATASHLFALNVLVAQALLVVLVVALPDENRSERLRSRLARSGPVILAPLAALALSAVLYLPQIRAGSTEIPHFSFQASFPIALLDFFGGIAYRTDPDLFSFAISAVALVGLLSLATNRALRNYLGLLFLSPIALYGLSYLAPVFTLHPRFFTYLLPFFCPLVIAGLIHPADVLGAKTVRRQRISKVIRIAAGLGLVVIAYTLADRIDVPRGGAHLRAQGLVSAFVDSHPKAHLLTNDTGFVRVRLRQEENMSRIRSALGIKAIREFEAQEPAGAIYFIYIRQQRHSESALIHYQGSVSPEVLYQRDERLRLFLSRNATLELDVPPRVQIYTVRPRPETAPE